MPAVSAENEHEGWKDDAPDEISNLGFNKVDTSPFIFKLQFDVLGGKSPGKGKGGTGFYINLPCPKYDIMLTAAHNLIDESREHTQNLTIIEPGRPSRPVKEKEIRISAIYEKHPGEDSEIHDYGAILLEKDDKQPRPGFGFSLMHALNGELMIKSQVHVHGFPAEKDILAYSSGNCERDLENQLWYDAETSTGMSGSPVFVAYKGMETVVGIHNYGAGPGCPSQRATRISLKVLREICVWADLTMDGRSLQAKPSKSIPYDIRLCFAPSLRQFGRVRVRPAGPNAATAYNDADAEFDILLAYSPPGYSPCKKTRKTAYYAFFYKGPLNEENTRPKEARWVAWNPDKEIADVTFSSDLRERCLVQIEDKSSLTLLAFPSGMGGNKTHESKELVLKMSLKEWDLQMLTGPGDFRDTSGVCFGKYGGGKPQEYNNFSFPPA